MAGDRLRRVPTILLVLLVPVVALVTVLVTLNITSNGTSAAAGSRSGKAGGGTAIAIENFRYSPDPLVVKARDTITVSNDDGTLHTLTADDKSFDTGDLDGGTKATIAVASPGTYTYHCDVHNYMTGKIVAR
jgi:plastocyanin